MVQWVVKRVCIIVIQDSLRSLPDGALPLQQHLLLSSNNFFSSLCSNIQYELVRPTPLFSPSLYFLLLLLQSAAASLVNFLGANNYFLIGLIVKVPNQGMEPTTWSSRLIGEILQVS